jgi:ligand-binding SRPBCC domain-containing protein
MPTYTRQTRVAAPLESVWDFHSGITGLEALTPGWMNLRVEAVRGPDGEPDPAVLTAGTRVRLSVRPFGVGPRQRWTSRIVVRERDEARASFRDVMEDGPFRRWEHTHSFFADDGATVVSDRIEYELPFGAVGRALGPTARVGFEPMFRYRHRRTRELLEATDGEAAATTREGGEPA